MKLNIWKSQNEVEKTYKVDKYDIFYGTVEDVLKVIEEAGDGATEEQLVMAVVKNRDLFNRFLKDIFDGLTDEELRRTKVKEIAPLLFELFDYARTSLASKN